MLGIWGVIIFSVYTKSYEGTAEPPLSRLLTYRHLPLPGSYMYHNHLVLLN